MHTKLTCRIMGWVFVLLGIIGCTSGSLGVYLRFNLVESYITLAMGIISVFAARRRHRVSALTALFIGVCCAIWEISPLVLKTPTLGTVEPLDVVIHGLAAIWGMGTAVQDVWQWRTQVQSSL